jgi:predicted nucleotidyltransferase
MKLTQHEREVLAGVVRRLKTDFHAEQVILYGSAARGEMDSESDIDLLAVMADADWETKKKVCASVSRRNSISGGSFLFSVSAKMPLRIVRCAVRLC